MKKGAQPKRRNKTSGFGKAVLASLRAWKRGKPLTVRTMPLQNRRRSGHQRNDLPA